MAHALVVLVVVVVVACVVVVGTSLCGITAMVIIAIATAVVVFIIIINIIIIGASSSSIAEASDITLATVVTSPLRPISSKNVFQRRTNTHQQRELAAGNDAGCDGGAPTIVATMVSLIEG